MMQRFGRTLQWMVLALVLLAVLLVFGAFAWRGCSGKAGRGPKTTTPPQHQAGEKPKEQPAGNRSARSNGQSGEAGQAASSSKNQSSPGPAGGASEATDGDGQAAPSENGVAGAPAGAATGTQGAIAKPDGKARPQGGLPGLKGGVPGPEGSFPAASAAGTGEVQGGGENALADAGLAPEEVAQAVAAARDAAAKARQSAQRGEHRQAYQSALAGWKAIRGLAKFDKEASAAADELFRLLQQYGKTLEGHTEPPAPTDSTPLITR